MSSIISRPALLPRDARATLKKPHAAPRLPGQPQGARDRRAIFARAGPDAAPSCRLDRASSRAEHACDQLLERWRLKPAYPAGNCGGRFSRCEARPSFTSGPAKPMNSSASEASKVGPAWRSQLLSAYLVQRMALCAPSARRVAISTALASSSASSTARLMRPMRSASAPAPPRTAADNISPSPCRTAAARRSPHGRPPRRRAAYARR